MQSDNKEQTNKDEGKTIFILSLILDMLILALFVWSKEMNGALKALIIVLSVIIMLCSFIISNFKAVEENHRDEEGKQLDEQESKQMDKKSDDNFGLKLSSLVMYFFFICGDSIPREFWIAYIVISMLVSTIRFFAKQRKTQEENPTIQAIDDDTYLDFIANHELVLIYFYDRNAIDDIILTMKNLQQECKKEFTIGYYDISDKHNTKFFDDNDMQFIPSIIIFQDGIEVKKAHGSFSIEELLDF